jgi:hypothetical protein
VAPKARSASPHSVGNGVRSDRGRAYSLQNSLNRFGEDHNFEARECARAERGHDRDVGGIAPTCHQDTADAGLVVAGTERVPAAARIVTNFDFIRIMAAMICKLLATRCSSSFSSTSFSSGPAGGLTTRVGMQGGRTRRSEEAWGLSLSACSRGQQPSDCRLPIGIAHGRCITVLSVELPRDIEGLSPA